MYILHDIIQNLSTLNRYVYFCTANYPFWSHKRKATVNIYLGKVSDQLKILCLYYIIISIDVLIYLISQTSKEYHYYIL